LRAVAALAEEAVEELAEVGAGGTVDLLHGGSSRALEFGLGEAVDGLLEVAEVRDTAAEHIRGLIEETGRAGGAGSWCGRGSTLLRVVTAEQFLENSAHRSHLALVERFGRGSPRARGHGTSRVGAIVTMEPLACGDGNG
jgi:hypothetical protein